MKIILLLSFIGLSTAAGLRDKTHRIIVGAAISPNHFATDPEYMRVAAAEFNSVTAEWQMKWDPIGNDPNNENYDLAEQLMSFAAQNNQKVRGHALIWHSATPAWVHALENNPAELEKVLVRHINETTNHFRGRVYDWDVVNEVIGDDASIRDSIFSRVFGTEFISQAFRVAHAADPDVKLYINDYNIEGINAKSDALYNLVQRLLSEGVPIHGVGFQGHFIVGQVNHDFVANMQRFADLNLDVAITELDIRMTLPPTQANSDQQMLDYEEVFNACFQVTRCVGVTIWGVIDKYSWIPNTFPGQGAALLFDDDYNRKAAYNAVDNVLNSFSSSAIICSSNFSIFKLLAVVFVAMNFVYKR